MVFGSGEHFSDEELDDKVLISESCNYLNNVLTKLLNPRSNMFNVNDIIKSELFIGSPCSIRQSMTSSVRQFSMTSSVRQFVTDLRLPCSMTSSIRQFLRHD